MAKNTKENQLNIYIKSRRTLYAILFIIVATVVAYWHLPKNGFISFDDDVYVTNNPHVQKGLTWENIKWAFTTFHAFNWHPITWMSHMIDSQLFGLRPSIHHLMNLLFHLVNSILLFLVLKALSDDVWPSWVVAILFAIHPIHVESVAWISERKDVLSTFFFILALYFYYRYSKRQSIHTYIPIGLCFMVGLMAKPMIVTLPFVLLLLDIWPLQRITHAGSIGRLTVEKIPLFMLTGLSCAITFIAQKQSGIVRSLTEFPLSMRLENAVVSYVRYIWKMVYPLNLSFFYPYPEAIPAWQVIGAVSILVGVTIFFVRKISSKPFLMVGWLWYMGTLIPVVGLVQVGAQSIADRYTYIPSIGVFIMIAWGLKSIVEGRRRFLKSMAGLSMILLTVLIIMTWKQVGYWEGDLQLYSHAVEVTKENPRSNYHLGLSLERKGNIERAIRYYKEAVRIKPDYLRARNSLGNAYLKLGRYADAVAQYAYALKIKKNYADGHFDLGFALMNMGKLDQAEKEYIKAIGIDKNHVDAHYNLGIILSRKKKYSLAIKHFREVARINPNDADAYNNLGNSFLRIGKTEKAIRFYKKAIMIDPNYTIAQRNLHAVLEHQRGRDKK